MSINTQFEDNVSSDHNQSPDNLKLYRNSYQPKSLYLLHNNSKSSNPLQHSKYSKNLTNSESHPYLMRLHGIANEYDEQIQENLPILHNLQKQCSIYRKICNKQKQKIEKNGSSSGTTKLLVEEYQKEIQNINKNK